jgi:hypothetical protein
MGVQAFMFIDRIKVVAWPIDKDGNIIIKWSVASSGHEFCYDYIIPKDHSKSVFDELWNCAKEKLENEMVRQAEKTDVY